MLERFSRQNPAMSTRAAITTMTIFFFIGDVFRFPLNPVPRGRTVHHILASELSKGEGVGTSKVVEDVWPILLPNRVSTMVRFLTPGRPALRLHFPTNPFRDRRHGKKPPDRREN